MMINTEPDGASDTQDFKSTPVRHNDQSATGELNRLHGTMSIQPQFAMLLAAHGSIRA
jgi:hypothetical protein